MPISNLANGVVIGSEMKAYIVPQINVPSTFIVFMPPLTIVSPKIAPIVPLYKATRNALRRLKSQSFLLEISFLLWKYPPNTEKVVAKGIITEKYNQLSPLNKVMPPANVCPISINNNAVTNENRTPKIRPFNEEMFFKI